MKAPAAKRQPCFECGAEAVSAVREPFTTRSADGLEITVPDVPLERCTECGDLTVPAASAEMIDAWIDRVTSRLTREELQAFLGQYQLTQKQAEDILGLGEKMISRWLKGPFKVSASMSNYIRLLLADPDTFETLRKRRWKRGGKTDAKGNGPSKLDPEEKRILSDVVCSFPPSSPKS